MTAKTRIAYLVTHPIHYQAPLLRRISAEPDIDLTVFFCSNFTVKGFHDPEFKKQIEWDVPLLEGYRHEFLPSLGSDQRVTFWKPWNFGLTKRLREGDFDFLWVHGYARWFHLYSLFRAKTLGIKTGIRDEATSVSAQRSWIKKRMKRVFFRLLSCVTDLFLAIGTMNREYYLENGIPAARIFDVPYTVDNAFFQRKGQDAVLDRENLRTSLGFERSRPIILYASKLTGRKRAEDLLEAYSRLSPDRKMPPAANLLFIGDGDQRIELETKVKNLGWSTVKVIGFVNQGTLARYYDLCDIFVLPSLGEPWGLVVNEVMNSGKPTIVSNQVGAGLDLVIPGETGCRFKGGDVDDLKRALTFMLENDERRLSMGRKSLKLIDGWSFEKDVQGLRQALKLKPQASL